MVCGKEFKVGLKASFNYSFLIKKLAAGKD
jgi:hypothetical protein